MRIGIEAQRLYRHNKAGMDVVVYELIRNLQEIDKENEYFIFIRSGDDPCLKETSNFHILEIPATNFMSWEQFVLPRAAKKAKIDLLHCTSNTAPLFSPVPLVLTLHDVIFLEAISTKSRGTLYQEMGKIYRRNLVPRLVKKCEKIITVSKQEKVRIVNRLNLPSEQIDVVYNGVSDDFHQVKDAKLLQEVRETYGLPESFFLFLGNHDPRKNMLQVLDVFGKYVEEFPEATLVMTAIKADSLRKMLDKLGRPALANNIILPGFVPKEHLPSLFTLATVYLYPSMREGFGLPILEAFGCGTPVITSNTSSMPEIAGDAALLVDPFDPQDIKRAMVNLMNDPLERADKVAQGFEQVKAFSWRSMAEEVLGIYREVLGENKHEISEVHHH